MGLACVHARPATTIDERPRLGVFTEFLVLCVHSSEVFVKPGSECPGPETRAFVQSEHRPLECQGTRRHRHCAFSLRPSFAFCRLLMIDASAVPPIADQSLGRRDLLALLGASSGELLRFVRCDFESADLSRLDLRGARFEDCQLAEASLERSVLADTVWRGCKARQANFHLADLSDAKFERCDLNMSQWARAKLASVAFVEVKLTGAQFGGAQSLGLSFKHSLLVGADLRGISFRKQLLQQLNFADADVSGCDFRDAIFEGGSLRDAHLKQAQFAGADLRGVDLGGLKLADAAQFFRGATISAEQAAALIEELGLRVL